MEQQSNRSSAPSANGGAATPSEPLPDGVTLADQARHHEVNGDDPRIRADKVDRVRSHLASGSYDTSSKIERIVGGILDDLDVEDRSAAEESLKSQSLSLFFSTTEFSATDVAMMLDAMSALYKSAGGDDLIIEDISTINPAHAPTPSGGES